ncbi:tripartite motif-containing protein 2-like [Mercenaria mercenaria]|uniref:tripartite motif-containing protein 2-like n=1 Tax=Mercenaria mercenaria TaxID=6596 RepID=UPI001E1DCC1B|nr:tripartite motif-containing protein 2-like [Mercenaria mercenaria]
MADTEKSTEDPNFKGGVMSPNSQQTFAAMRYTAPPVAPRQKIVLDEESFEYSFLRCMVCKEKYNMEDRSPRLLPCHHAFCMSCLLAIYQREENYRQSLAPTKSVSGMSFAIPVSCPNCSSNFITTLEGLKQLMIDHRVVQLMDFVGHTDKQTITFCPNHALQPLNFFCEKCVQPICRDCTVLDHKVCSQEQLVIDLASATEKYTPALDEGIVSMREEIKSLTEKKEDCQKALDNSQKGDDSLTKSIKESFDKIRKALNDREKEILEMTNGNGGNSTESVEEKLTKLSDKEKEVEEILEAINNAKSAGTVQEMFIVYKKIREYTTESGIEKDVLQKSDQPSSTFVTRDESTIISRISGYGEIQSLQKQSNGYSSTSGLGYTSSGSSYLGSSSRYTSYTPSYTSRYQPRTYKY